LDRHVRRRAAAAGDRVRLHPHRPSLGHGLFAIERFVEKPDAATAARYLAEGYLWNSGNFMFRARFLLDEYSRFEPDSATAVAAAVVAAGTDLGFVTLGADAFTRAAAKSIDYAVMERTARACVMPVSYGWSDVGSWQAVWELSAHEAAENAAHGPAVFVDARGSYVATDRQLVALLGLDNVVVVTTADAVLVARREASDGLRRVVGKLKEVAPALTEDHLKVHRPWGSYQSLDQGKRYQVKRIVVKQGGRLSQQMHHHRAEHWVVVRGTARVTIGDNVTFLHENESIYVPSGARHRLENPGKVDLELIEFRPAPISARTTSCASRTTITGRESRCARPFALCDRNERRRNAGCHYSTGMSRTARASTVWLWAYDAPICATTIRLLRRPDKLRKFAMMVAEAAGYNPAEVRRKPRAAAIESTASSIHDGSVPACASGMFLEKMLPNALKRYSNRP
jgi:mannose-6-phosphate isomerase-like protein (cupin superfamily)